MNRRYTVILTPTREDDETGYTVTVPALPGCITEGDTFEEAMDNAREAIALYVESLLSRGMAAPEEAGEVIASLEVPLGELAELQA